MVSRRKKFRKLQGGKKKVKAIKNPLRDRKEEE